MPKTQLDTDSLNLTSSFGVGTTAPTQALDVRSASGGNIVAGRTTNVGVNSEPGTFYSSAPNASGAARQWMGMRTIVTNATGGSEASAIAFHNQVAGAYAETMRIDGNGNIGIGVTAPISIASYRSIDVSGSAASILRLMSGANPGLTMIGSTTEGAVKAENSLPLTLYTGNAERARFDASGNLLVGVTSGSNHTIAKSGAEGTVLLTVVGNGAASNAYFQTISSNTGNGAATGLYIGKNSTTSRSINAGGTINASGADYAEYMTKANDCGVLAKGQIVGIDADGHLTDKFAAAVSFLIKSTDPSYVGGDVWGSEAALGMERPVEPIFEAPAYAGAPDPGAAPDAPAEPEDQEDPDYLAALALYESTAAHYQALLAQFEADQAAYDEAVTSAKYAFKTITYPAYEAQLATFNAALEAARQKVDRIAYCGQVPVNVTGAVPGQYVVPIAAGDGIAGQLVDADAVTFDQYRRAVGIVQNILPDGRANVRVKPV